MNNSETPKRRRGRPAKADQNNQQTRADLIRAGLELLTEKGFFAAGLDEILRRVNVPKGSFYHYFKSKEAFGLELLDEYDRYFQHKLKRHLGNQNLSPIERIRAFVTDAEQGLEKYEFRRGCLVGNLGQEMTVLPEGFRSRLLAVLESWRSLLASSLEEHTGNPELAEHLAEFFWIGWEGAVMQARLAKSCEPLRVFHQGFERLLDSSGQ